MAQEHIYLIGIGGTGMTALAGLLHASGCRVSGSDRALYPPTSQILESMGLEVHGGFDPAHLVGAPDLVVVGNAISRGNPELEEVLDRGLTYVSMPSLIADRFLRDRHAIVVAGTHGKTTTTSMVSWLLARAGRDPGFLIGGLPLNFEYPYRLGRGRAFVIEGDEYDTAFFDKGPKFMHYRPDSAILGTVEFDHADIYRDLDQVKAVFRRLTHLIPGRGLLVRHEDCAVTREVTTPAWCRVEGYGIESGRWRAVDLVEKVEGCSFRVLRGEESFAEIRMPVGGEYNVCNALAAIAVASEQGITAAEIVDGLATFRGVRRRLEMRGVADGVTVLDDFAHHPTAVEATVRVLRRRYPKQKLWVVLEPRSWSLRRNTFQERLPAAFDAADEVVIADVYRPQAVPAAERLDTERVVRDLRARGLSARHLPDAGTIAAHLAGAAGPGDVVVLMSNGGFDGLHERLLESLRERGDTVAERQSS